MKLNMSELLHKIGKDRLVILVLMGLLLIVIAIPVEKKDTKSNKNPKQSEKQISVGDTQTDAVIPNDTNINASEITTTQYGEMIANKLEDILQYMEGVGKVKVYVTMNCSKELIVEKDTPYTRDNTNETDSAGGSRNITNMNNEDNTVYDTDSEGNKTPYVIKELEPMVEGIMVVAEGGGNEQTAVKIKESLCGLFGIASEKVTVADMK